MFFCILFFLFTVHTSAMQEYPQQKNGIAFWNTIQKGANIFNREIVAEDIRAAKAYGINFIRLAPDKFPTCERDFLIGNADGYTHLVAEDLEHLKKVLDICAQEEMPAVLTMLSLPGSRWKQNNNDIDDVRLWHDPQFQEQAAQFWKDLVTALYNHPAIIGYNILNEPHPERLFNARAINSNDAQQEVQEILFNFYELIINAIRSADKTTPIILDSSFYADPRMFKNFKTHNDAALIYSFHMYEPYEYTNKRANADKFSYPGIIDSNYWDKQTLKKYMGEVLVFQNSNAIPNNRILVGEFGGHRTTMGLENYFNDLIEIFEENLWHFAFYAFREDTWDGMDYEFGSLDTEGTYLERTPEHPQFKVLMKFFATQ